MKNIGILIELQRIYYLSLSYNNSKNESSWSVTSLLHFNKDLKSSWITHPATYRKFRTGATIRNQTEISKLLCNNLNTVLTPNTLVFHTSIYDILLSSLQVGNFTKFYKTLNLTIERLKSQQLDCQKLFQYDGYFFEQLALQTLCILQKHFEFAQPFSYIELFFLNTIKNFFSPSMFFLIEYASFRNLYTFSTKYSEINDYFLSSSLSNQDDLLSSYANSCYRDFNINFHPYSHPVLRQSLETTYTQAIKVKNTTIQLAIAGMMSRHLILDFDLYRSLFHKHQKSLPKIHVVSHLHFIGLELLKRQNFYSSYFYFLDAYQYLPNPDSLLYVYILAIKLQFKRPTIDATYKNSDHPSKQIYRYFRIKKITNSTTRCRNYLRLTLLPLIRNDYPLLIPFFIEEIKKICSHHLCNDESLLIEILLASSQDSCSK